MRDAPKFQDELKRDAVDYAMKLNEPARRESLKWLVNFKTKIGPFSQCPRCAGTYSQQSNLEPTGHGTEKMDTFKCRVCGLEKAHVFPR